MGFRDAVRVVHIDRHIRVRAAQINRHAHRGPVVGDALHALGHFGAAAIEFALELRQQRVGVFTIQFVERAARHHRHSRGDQAHGQQ